MEFLYSLSMEDKSKQIIEKMAEYTQNFQIWNLDKLKCVQDIT